MAKNFKEISVEKNINADTISEKIFSISEELKKPDDVFKFYVELHEYLERVHEPLRNENERKRFLKSVIGVEVYDTKKESKLPSTDTIYEKLYKEGLSYTVKPGVISLSNGETSVEVTSNKEKPKKLLIKAILAFAEKLYK